MVVLDFLNQGICLFVQPLEMYREVSVIKSNTQMTPGEISRFPLNAINTLIRVSKLGVQGYEAATAGCRGDKILVNS